jgi:hypothetical protein
MNEPPNPLSDRHARYVGWVASRAVRHGIRVLPERDKQGRYTGLLRLPFIKDHVTVEVIVPPPPDDWER